MTGLADCNNFFVSCERTVHPELEGRPVVVGSNNDGCVVARSNEAKRLGIKMGQPMFKLRDLIRSGQLIALSGHHLLYKEISIQVHEIIRRFVPATIDYSVDEAFLDMDGIPLSALPEIGRGIVDACRREAGIPVTVGFAATKTLAKIITELSKKNGHSIGILTEGADVAAALASLPIDELWGVGRRLSRRMYLEGVHTIADFANMERVRVRQRFGVNGERSWLELHGTPCLTLDYVGHKIQDSISESRTFPFDVTEYDYIRARIAMYTDHCSRRLRGMHALCKRLTVMLHTNRFHTENGYHAPQITVVFNTPVCDTHTLVSTALEGLKHIFDPELKYKRGGVLLSEIIPGEYHTPSLFAAEQNPHLEKMRRLLKVIDRLNRDNGSVIMPLAAELSNIHPVHNDGYSSTFQFRK